jgi:NADP-dependent 3-hydroxy acid dehydrogenase YdfG
LALERAAKEVPDKFGTVDSLINNAGLQRKHNLKKPTPVDF